MRVTFNGVRGSVPTPGPSTVRYGGNTSCVDVLLADGTLLVLDAGTGIRSLGERLMRDGVPDVIHLLVTHVHWDHIIGAPFFKPIWVPGKRVNIYAFSPDTFSRMENPVLFDGVHFPIRFGAIPATIETVHIQDAEMRIGSATIRRIALNHPGGSDGFRVDDDGGASLCFLTDNELHPPGTAKTTTADLARFARGADMIIHDAQYVPADMPAKLGWGHSLVDDVLALGRDADTRHIAFYHHEPERSDDALDVVANDANEWQKANAPDMKVVVSKEGDIFEF